MTPLTIGHYYNVPCVLINNWHEFKGWIPIIGPKHDDAEIIGFDLEHFHLDWRFVSSAMFKMISRWHRPERVYSHVISCPDNLGRQVITEGPALRKCLCKREWPALPKLPWREKLEAAMASKRMQKGICPHRGVPLTNCPVVDGVVMCPAHGLAWRVDTGELVRLA